MLAPLPLEPISLAARSVHRIENAKGIRGLEIKARFLRGEMEHLRLREFQPGLCRYVERADQAV